MSARDRRLAQTKYAGRKSASEAAREKAARRGQGGARTPGRGSDDGLDTDLRGMMQAAMDAPRDAASLARGRASRRNAADGDGGESYADRSTRGFLSRTLRRR